MHYDEDQGGNKIFDDLWYIESLENYANQLESQLKEEREKWESFVWELHASESAPEIHRMIEGKLE